MRAGTLRHRIAIEQVTVSKDARGQKVETWTVIARPLANVSQTAGREAVQAAQVNAEATWAVTMRFVPGITTEHRIRFGDRVLEILSVINVGHRDRELEIAAKEHQADAQ